MRVPTCPSQAATSSSRRSFEAGGARSNAFEVGLVLQPWAFAKRRIALSATYWNTFGSSGSGVGCEDCGLTKQGALFGLRYQYWQRHFALYVEPLVGFQQPIEDMRNDEVVYHPVRLDYGAAVGFKAYLLPVLFVDVKATATAESPFATTVSLGTDGSYPIAGAVGTAVGIGMVVLGLAAGASK